MVAGVLAQLEVVPPGVVADYLLEVPLRRDLDKLPVKLLALISSGFLRHRGSRVFPVVPAIGGLYRLVEHPRLPHKAYMAVVKLSRSLHGQFQGQAFQEISVLVNVKHKGVDDFNLLAARVKVQPQGKGENRPVLVPWEDALVNPFRLDHRPDGAGLLQGYLLGDALKAADGLELTVVVYLLVLDEGHQLPAHGPEAVPLPQQGGNQFAAALHPAGQQTALNGHRFHPPRRKQAVPGKPFSPPPGRWCNFGWYPIRRNGPST